jgi:thiol-disulfide isomerase/thioredoxin
MNMDIVFRRWSGGRLTAWEGRTRQAGCKPALRLPRTDGRREIGQLVPRLAWWPLLLFAVSVLAQTPSTNPPVRVLRPLPGVRLAPEEARALAEQRKAARTNDAASTTSATNTMRGAASDDLASALRTMSFNRTPQALFDAMKSQQGGGLLSAADRFRIAVLLGDWDSVSNALKALPAEDAMRAYSRLLESLATNSLSAAQFFQQLPAARPAPVYNEDGELVQQPNPDRRDKRALFLSDDFYALVNTAPADLEAVHLPHLATLMKVALGTGGKKDFLVRLEKGLKGLGGTTPGGRKLAAQLLSTVGWMTDAGPYLPLQRTDWDQADTFTLVLTLEYFTQTGLEQRDERQFKKAAELCAFMMQTSRFGASERGLFRQATDRFVKLLPALEADDAEQLIRENFLTQPAILVDLILALGESGQQAQRGTDLNLRGQSLATQNVLLRVLAGRKSALPEAVNVLVMNWLGEAESTYRSGLQLTPNSDEYDSPFIYRPPSYYSRRRDARVLGPDLILSRAPSPTLIRRLNQGLAQRVKLTLLKVNFINPKDPVTVETLAGYVKEYPGQEKELCQDYLAAWVRKHSVPAEDPNIVRMRAMGYIISRPQQATGGIPLTRLRQNLNVTEFKNLLASLRPLSPDPIEPSAIVQGFMAIHSGAEVYRQEDIETIFGPPEKMNRAELMQLVTGMRTKLREQWQDAKTQQDAGTNRTEQETKDEVSRGYRTALALVRRGLRPEDADWKQFIVRGQLFFDAAEYEFARQIKLADYVNLRDEAFGSYRKAAEIYAAKLPEMPRGQWTMEPYQMWFFVMLGASDLSQLTRAAARSDPGLKQIGDAMRALPGEAAEGHLQKFGQMLADLLSQVPANMKQRFLSAGLQVVGEGHPSAKAALDSLNNYKELLDEAQLRVVVDGPTRVGHGQPFGLILSLEHTRQLARESGGFSKYIQSPASQQRMAMYVAPNPQRSNYRDDFAKNIHAALDETFEISSITFHDANVRSIDLPREGWQETPLAYVLLRAKEAAVDRLPSIQLDMDFSDVSGQVVLPVRSQVQPLDAKEAEVAPRPCEDLALTFTMDEREWREGRVVIEVTSKGRGVIPSHLQMFDYAQPGFDVEVTDNGLSITEFVSDGKTRQAHSDRNWQITYKRKKDVRGDAVLHFPALKPGIKTAAVEYKHYQDADLVALDTKQAAAGVPLKSRASSALRNAALALIVVVLGVAAYLLRRAKGRQAQAAVAPFALPTPITPFSAVAFLRRVQREAGARLDESARRALATQIEEIEAAFFRGTPAPANAPDLPAIARNWLQAASKVMALPLLLLAGAFAGLAAELGEPAAALDIAEWVKGDAVSLADAKGHKIIVVEFWATWCGPCRVSIPHLTELQQKFADRGVVVIGVSDEDVSKVRPFVDQMGEKMGYTVAVDNNRRTAQGYMAAYGINGIPHAFVVDLEGRVAWHGHPMSGLDQALDKLAKTAVTEKPEDKKRVEAQRKLREFTALAARGEDPAKLDQLAEQLAALDKEMGGIEPNRKLDLVELRRTARFQGLMREYQSAVAAGKPQAELAKLEQQAAPLAPKGFKFEDYRGQFSLQRTFQDYYRAVTGKGDATQTPGLATRLASVKSSDIDALNEMAWTLLTDEKIKTRDLALALKLARSAFEASSGKDPGVLDTYARALFDNGQPAEAVAQQQRAIELTDDKSRKAEMEESLKRYQAGSGARR